MRQGLAEPGHDAIQLLQVEGGGAVDGLVGDPLQSAAVGSGSEQGVQHGEEDGAFGVEAEAAADEGAAQGVTATGELPQALADEGGDGGMLGEARAGEQEAVEDAAGLEQDPAAERPDVALADLGAGASILDEVELAELSVGLGAGSRGEGSCYYEWRCESS